MRKFINRIKLWFASIFGEANDSAYVDASGVGAAPPTDPYIRVSAGVTVEVGPIDMEPEWTKPFTDPSLNIPDQTAAGNAIRAKLPGWYSLIAQPLGYAARELLWSMSTYPGGLRDDPHRYKIVDVINRLVIEPQYSELQWREIVKQLFTLPGVRKSFIDVDVNADHGIWLTYTAQKISPELRSLWNIPTVLPTKRSTETGRMLYEVV